MKPTTEKALPEVRCVAMWPLMADNSDLALVSPSPMKRIVAAALVVVMVAGAADAQAIGGNGESRKQHQQRTNKSDSQKTKTDDKAYNAALKNLPDKPFDPWRNAR